MEYLIDVRDIIVTKTKEMTSYLSFKSSFLRKIITRDSKEGRFFFGGRKRRKVFRSRKSLLSFGRWESCLDSWVFLFLLG